MTNKELMLAGHPFIGGDAELMEDKARARSISNKYNSIDDCDENCKVARGDVLKQLLGKCGDGIFIKPPFRCDYGYNISVGEKFFANFDCTFLDAGKITIGDNCMLGPHTCLLAVTHPKDLEERKKGINIPGDITFGDNVWLGGNVTVLPGVSLGNNVVVGAGSVVTKSFPDNVVIAGNPATIVENLETEVTESRNPKTMYLDCMSPIEIVTAMNREDALVSKAIESQLENIARCVSWAEESLNNDGRIIYMGAGTSGRLGVLDASECPPTFGVDSSMVIGLIAGGKEAILKAIEGAEDNIELGVTDLKDVCLTKKDIVIGLAASGKTPYVIGGLTYANEIGCHTVGICCNAGSMLSQTAELAIEAIVGPEILMGSTRLKAGTAQKMILNMISTAAMVRTGKVYQNLMVDVAATNDKLRLRAENIVMQAALVDREKAKKALALCNGKAKPAILMLLTGCSAEEACKILKVSNGRLRNALQTVGGDEEK